VFPAAEIVFPHYHAPVAHELMLFRIEETSGRSHVEVATFSAAVLVNKQVLKTILKPLPDS
jgi:hypothetical protein